MSKEGKKDLEQPPKEVPTALPTLGRVVMYKLTERDAQKVDGQRADGRNRGSTVRAGTVCPAFVVGHNRSVRSAVDENGKPAPDIVSESINLKVQLDGTDEYYVKGVTMGPDDGQAQWPARV